MQRVGGKSHDLRVERGKSQRDLAATANFRSNFSWALGNYMYVEQRGRGVEIPGAYSPELVEKHLVEPKSHIL